MAEFSYTAVDKHGIIFTDKAEDSSRISLINRLKRNNLTPIEVVSIGSKDREKQRINVSNDQILDIAEESLNQKRNTKRKREISANEIGKKKKILGITITTGARITERDVVIFTKNFYSLKVAGFNNIHALTTLIKGTENETFRVILQNILNGVESRRIYVSNNGNVSRCISCNLYKFNKSW